MSLQGGLQFRSIDTEKIGVLVGETAGKEATWKPAEIILFKGFQILASDAGLLSYGFERKALAFPLSPEKCADRRHWGSTVFPSSYNTTPCKQYNRQ